MLLDEGLMCSSSVLKAAATSFDAFFGAGAQTTIQTATAKTAGAAPLDCMLQFQRRASEAAGPLRRLAGGGAGVVVAAVTRLGPATSEADQRALLQAVLQLPPNAAVFGAMFAAMAARLSTNATDFSATLVTSKTALSSGVRAATVIVERGTCWDAGCWTAAGILGAVIFAIGVAFLVCLANYYRVKRRCPPLCGKSTKRAAADKAAAAVALVPGADSTSNPLVVISQRFGRQLKREESAMIEDMDEEDLATLARFKAEKAAARAAAKEAKAAAAAAAATAAAATVAPAAAAVAPAAAAVAPAEALDTAPLVPRSEFLPVGTAV